MWFSFSSWIQFGFLLWLLLIIEKNREEVLSSTHFAQFVVVHQWKKGSFHICFLFLFLFWIRCFYLAYASVYFHSVRRASNLIVEFKPLGYVSLNIRQKQQQQQPRRNNIKLKIAISRFPFTHFYLMGEELDCLAFI